MVRSPQLLLVSRTVSTHPSNSTKGDVGVDKEVSTKKQQHHLSTTAAQHYQSPIPPRSSTTLQPVVSFYAMYPVIVMMRTK